MATVVVQHPATRTNAFERWWQCQGTWVEPLNQRRDGESGVQRLKRHCGAMPEGDWQLLMQAYTAALAT